MNGVPAVCDSCGYTFPSPFSIQGSRNSTIVNCATNCPRCGGNARVVNSFTDSRGNLHFQGFFSKLKSYENTVKLKEFKEQVAANEDVMTAVDLTDALTELDPSFSSFSTLIKSIPPSAIKYFINLLVTIVTLVIAYQTWQSADENHDESLELQKDQLSLAREEFEYQKQKDAEADQNLQYEIDALRSEFEQKIQEINRSNQADRSIPNAGVRIKGSLRNKPCPCGSGIKAKKCHPQGCSI